MNDSGTGLAVQIDSKGVTFKVCVQPRSSKNQIVGLHGDALKVKIKAPPVEGAANKMCLQYMAACLDLPKSCVEIKSGQTGRNKQVRVHLKPGSEPKKELQRLVAIIQAWPT